MTFTIKEHRPGRTRLLAVGLIVLWFLSMVLVHQYGFHTGIKIFDGELDKNYWYQKQLEEATQAGRDMQAQIAILDKTAQVDRQAKIELANNIKSLQNDVVRLREDVSFYKSIISPEKGHSGLNVYKFTTIPAGENLYHFKMILTQAGKSGSLAQGSVGIAVRGIMHNREETLELPEVRVSKNDPITYKFHYYQEISGSLRLPEGFQPQDIIVTLTSNKRHKTKHSVKKIDWQETRA